MQKWLSVVGIGEDGILGLNPVARSLVEQAEVLVGGDRHLNMLPESDRREKLVWASPLNDTIEEIIRRRGRSLCVLASGDPMCFGIGVTLLRRIPIAEMTIIPSPSAFSLACARLGWSLTEVETLSLTGRDPSLLHPVIYPGARLLILSEGRKTPAIVAEMLVKRGFGNSQITVLERMGGTHERIVKGVAASWNISELADLNTIAVECIADSPVMLLKRTPGLPDTAYHHDGQLTKHEVRAITLAALAPIPGQLLWDVGAGCGSIGIEWMRSHYRCRAIAIEQNLSRLRYITDNAAALGTPNLCIIQGEAPAALEDLEAPDAIFIGGGATAEGIFDICWHSLKSGGRFVANAVTVESEQKLLQWHNQVGGTLTRIAIQRAEPVGKFLGWKAMAPVTQWVVVK
ncbi:bifunctional cobalt-precorrin-7 (C(5))-methyltransferase/cobalt-precorrin-6B (C(15))-methyltransferase [Scytonema hofmannii FACHB-248]|uniref:Bifunctional cobalt-precorrin-7 (C(5))-methyltransferase/cobalt-precorrin-6B (C(15))-methyltransferase n=1 Tax=Scytonema hofmannii FACHB-248 TaxID=1842502 RepID=A0ABR8GJE2_9CYAN|nr:MULTISPECIES: bifunctional cobalt-precorrin-7 (C(5))-methyltransferase/cobalt-precorrin-6B (C(15))-methyltransferase [Nostocales]MBD2603174.1 bifunctional cobalt-precorrin-7 (C(5))-methyltransferase/cobalt-precorrin-6B (C(15))-methyltransferase [Scytonema hofmannii FACHB-248]